MITNYSLILNFFDRRKIPALVLFLVFAGAIFAVLRERSDPYPNTGTEVGECSDPLTYRFGEVDPRFDIQISELQEVMKDVENLWSDFEAANLLEYRENGKVMINLIYDDRQKLVDEEQVLSERIETEKLKFNRLEQDYERLRSDYNTQLQSLEKDVEALDELLDRYHQGGRAPEANHADAQDAGLTSEELEAKIGQMKERVSKKTTELEKTRQRVNREADRLNEALERNKELIDDYNEKFSEGYMFHQGVYSREGDIETINIYKYEDLDDLRLILAHETGHALGLIHVQNSESVMHRMMGSQNKADLTLTDQDKEALSRICRN